LEAIPAQTTSDEGELEAARRRNCEARGSSSSSNKVFVEGSATVMDIDQWRGSLQSLKPAPPPSKQPRQPQEEQQQQQTAASSSWQDPWHPSEQAKAWAENCEHQQQQQQGAATVAGGAAAEATASSWQDSDPAWQAAASWQDPAWQPEPPAAKATWQQPAADMLLKTTAKASGGAPYKPAAYYGATVPCWAPWPNLAAAATSLRVSQCRETNKQIRRETKL